MTINHKFLQDRAIATAAEAQTYFMDQANVKVTNYSELATLHANAPDVLTAIVTSERQLYVKQTDGSWMPSGGTVHVGTSAPSNPKTGSVWYNPDLVIPEETFFYIQSPGADVTSRNDVYANFGSAYTYVNSTGRAIKAVVSYGGNVFVPANTIADPTGPIRARLSWTGATTGDTVSLAGGGAFRSLYADDRNNEQFMPWERTFMMTINNGTTTFRLQACQVEAAVPTQYGQLSQVGMAVCPVGFAEQWA